MQELTLSLDESTVEQLDTELDLLGFGTRSEYLRWLIDNRASIDQGTEHDRLLHAYADQLDALEQRLDALEAMNDDEQSSPPPAAPVAGETAKTGDRGDDTATLQIHGSPDATRTISGSESAGSNSSGSGTSPDTATGGVQPSTESGSTTKQSASTTTVGGDGAGSRAGETSKSAEEAGVTSMNLAPERVNRISGDPIAENADVLSGVETDRLDELTRRAVAKTREELDRTVETGLSYRSNTSLADDDVRAGDDITDLDGLELPGRSEETVAPRRVAAGHALAFLRDVGEARRADFVEALYDEVPAGYETESGWWNCIKEALKQVDAVEGGSGARIWRFRS